jgi:hypothetical protein
LRSVQRFGGRLRRGIADQDQQRQQSPSQAPPARRCSPSA